MGDRLLLSVRRGLSDGFDEPFGNLASNDEINNFQELPTEIPEFLFPNEPLTPAEPFVNQDINDNLQHFASEFPFLEEPSGVLSSNVDLDKSLDDLYGEISSLKKQRPSTLSFRV